jgi:death on curing protein
MNYTLINADDVRKIHNEVIHAYELQGEAKDKSLDAIIDRVINRCTYDLINDVFELAACYATYIAQGHAFNDANKRTAFLCMDTILILNDIVIDYGNSTQIADLIILCVCKKTDEKYIATYLKSIAKS